MSEGTVNLSTSPTSTSSTVKLATSTEATTISLSSLKIQESTVTSNKASDADAQGSRSPPSSPTSGGSSSMSSISVPAIQILTPTPCPSPPNGQSNENNVPPVQPKLKAILPSITSCVHTPCYCEENIWLLCDQIRTQYSSELEYCTVAFISNPNRMVPLWRQKSGKTEDKLTIWDYHVILLYNPDDRAVVYDLDSDLPFPTHFHKYVTETFRTESTLQPEYHRFFRILHASDFLQLFSSDRTHMAKDDGTFTHPPPPYPPIYRNGVNNLEEFLDMTTREKTEYGEVLPLMDMVRRFFKPKRLS